MRRPEQSMTAPQSVTIEQAYEEACQALGEALVQQRLIAKATAQQLQQLASKRDTAIAATREHNCGRS